MAQNRVRQVRASASRSVSSLQCESVGIRALIWVCFVARRRLLVLHSTSLVDGFPLFGGTPDVESGLPRILFKNSFRRISLYLSLLSSCMLRGRSLQSFINGAHTVPGTRKAEQNFTVCHRALLYKRA